MLERHTSIFIPGSKWNGLADWGRVTPEEMIKQARAYGRHLREQADAIEAAVDADFQVETYLGQHVRRNREVLQAGRAALAAKEPQR